ncbi:cytosine permease [Bacillus sp. S3]|uniref:purine-cytosine permease family protein n=1 Tax=Bacillus sp. S3 TaxID=486398 RepID=UPI001188ED03|nr:cytosine permease [Bacillus sp. S3]QCJ40612.1 cytosine permease [Bacillus sp. S3]
MGKVSEQQKVDQQDDFASERVPYEKRYNWLTITVIRFGQMSALSQFLLGATLGFGMTFWDAFWAITLGAVILEFVMIFIGYLGMKEGLQTSLLSRWTGFGYLGSGILGIIIGVSNVGWFGVQNAVFASGLEQLIGVLPFWAWCIISGAIVIGIVYFGVASMGLIAYVTVPLFLVVCFYSIAQALSGHSLGQLMASSAPGPHLSITAGATLVAGSFIVGGAVTPDMTRFNRTFGDVIKQTVIGVTLGEYTVALIGVLLAHALKTADVISIILTTSGVLGTVILIASTVKINDWNLYNCTLGVVNSVEVLTGRKVSRKKTTLVVGGLGVVFSAMGILDHFIGFLTLLSVFIPPVASIMLVDYFVLRRQRQLLDESREKGVLPSVTEQWNPVGFVAWIGGALAGQYITWGIASLNALIVAGVLYYLGGILFLKNRQSITGLYGNVKSLS